MQKSKKNFRGFTLIELLITVSIIGILSSVLYASFSDARSQSRDDIRQSQVREMQLAVEQYKNQNGTFPDQGCNNGGFARPGSCSEFIVGITPDFIKKLPESNEYGYRVSSSGDRYKIINTGMENVSGGKYEVYSLGAESW